MFQDDPVTIQGDHPLLLSQPKTQRRPGPAHPNYGIPPTQWPDVLRRIDQGEPLRQIAKDYDVSYQTIWRISQTARKQQEKRGE
jgi:DNA invertase Pin-like site-specific DNA recombinase